MSRKAYLVLSAVLFLLLAAMLVVARPWPQAARLFPLTIGLPTLALAGVQLVVAGRSSSPGGNLGAASDNRRGLIMCGWLLGFGLAVVVLGFRLASLVASLAFLRLDAREPWRLSLAISAGIYLFFLVLMDVALNVPFNGGIIAEAAGLRGLDDFLAETLRSLL